MVPVFEVRSPSTLSLFISWLLSLSSEGLMTWTCMVTVSIKADLASPALLPALSPFRLMLT